MVGYGDEVLIIRVHPLVHGRQLVEVEHRSSGAVFHDHLFDRGHVAHGYPVGVFQQGGVFAVGEGCVVRALRRRLFIGHRALLSRAEPSCQQEGGHIHVAAYVEIVRAGELVVVARRQSEPVRRLVEGEVGHVRLGYVDVVLVVIIGIFFYQSRLYHARGRKSPAGAVLSLVLGGSDKAL